MPYFDHLRSSDFAPTFTWVATAAEAADRINQPHEDYPQRVPMTRTLLEYPFKLASSPTDVGIQEIQNGGLEAIHWLLFHPEPHAGGYRQVNVRVGLHRPPHWELVPQLMFELQQHYLGKIKSVDDLVAWYSDFETIHPFQDGNGRVGGIVVACFAHARHPDQGWLAANQ